ncbi:MAG: alpha-galactosidase [Oscillospiraceae bacterium]|nr:alpha-galactosidase [Oscillospiraceae bacterium]
MPIFFNDKTKIFTVNTEKSTYAFMIDDLNLITHLYYGDKIAEGTDLTYLRNKGGVGRGHTYPEFTYEEFEAGAGRCCPHARLQEYSTFGIGDFRSACLSGEFADGSQAVDLRYVKHEIVDGKSALEGLPAVYANDNEKAQTLIVTLKDSVHDLYVELYYSVIEGKEALMRHSRIINKTGKKFFLNTALSANIDIFGNDLDVITFYGRPTNERYVERTPVRHGKISSQSTMGITGNFNCNSIILCDNDANETQGSCIGATLVYSSNYVCSAEVDHVNRTRLTIGINPDGFRWKLDDGEAFTTPEVIFTYTAEGLGDLSKNFHDIIRYNVCRGKWRDARRPILTNNWEATVFEFDEDKLVDIAKEAKDFGVEMLVVDDGWFGHRDWDNTSLGDWFEDKNKLPNGMPGLCKRLNDIGMKLGVWFEPEMISEESELYKNHPDYCIRVPDRAPMRGRWQLVLDMSREEIRDNIYEQMAKILTESPVAYIKWDMNRNITDAYSRALSEDRQGEFYHRYMLGVYELMERINKNFPDVLVENCCGGGGRFDAGMLYYSPQIWSSDNTDPYHRMKIQYGTSFVYPISTMGAHIAYAPNINTFHPATVFQRGVAAMAGTFGYELDPTIEDESAKKDMLFMTELYKKHYFTINHGDYYRLISPYKQTFGTTRLSVWEFVSKDKAHALVSTMQLDNSNESNAYFVKVRGLDESKNYKVNMIFETRDIHTKPFTPWIEQKELGVFSGEVLMKAGLHLNLFRGDNMASVLEIDAVE